MVLGPAAASTVFSSIFSTSVSLLANVTSRRSSITKKSQLQQAPTMRSILPGLTAHVTRYADPLLVGLAQGLEIVAHQYSIEVVDAPCHPMLLVV